VRRGRPGLRLRAAAAGPAKEEAPGTRRLIGIGALLVVIIAAIAAASGGGDHTVTTGTSGAAASTTSSPSKAAAAQTAKVGSAITLAGNDSGEQVAVTVVRCSATRSPPATSTPPSQVTSCTPSSSNGAEVVDASGHSYRSSLDNAAECQSFPGTENIAAGASGLGCIVFEVPVKAVITKVQLTLDSGMGPQTGQWDVHA
jgi:hypothetical protein